MEDFDQDQMLKDFEKEMKKNKKSEDEKVEVTLTDEQREKLQKATHDKLMLADKDGEIHHVEEIEYIIKDVLKHQHSAFKIPRVREESKETLELEEGEVNETFQEGDFDFGESSALIYLNDENVRNQRGVLLYLAKKIGVNLLTGKSIMNVSLPIKIFEPKSTLEKVANDYRFFPYYIKKAYAEKNPIERLKIMTTFCMASMQLEPQMLKPFNPILGETFQWTIGDYEFAWEQISHHPPISAFQIWKEGATDEPYCDGRLEYEANTGFSTITGYKTGYVDFHFPDTDHKITMNTFPVAEIHGLMKGTRTYDYSKTLKLQDEVNGLYSEVVFNPDKKGWFKRMFSSQKSNHDFFDGVITDSATFSYKDNRDEVEKMKKKHKIEVFGKVEGHWTNSMTIDGAEVWNYNSIKPYKLHYINNPLPSDGRFRTDLIALLNNDYSKAQEKKDELENLQRNDKKLRKQAKK